MLNESISYINEINRMIENYAQLSPSKGQINRYLASCAKLLDIKIAVTDILESSDDSIYEKDMLKAYEEQVKSIIGNID